MAKKFYGIYSPAANNMAEQVVRFYHMVPFTSPWKQLEKDCEDLALDGWRLVHVAVGQDGTALGNAIVAIYHR